ncbi:class E sortase [Ruania halotolerans]|uniref:class E sortase n=1 Tax=Ruania halotolerans TaxID=2897773 RepID=UPI001E53960A|nr:class E sortase [Ruania halotolerans]UFU06635.1 class E sortase [Ruania halotolerans]
MSNLDEIARDQEREDARAAHRRKRRSTQRPGASAVGVLGELLITAGVLLGLFVVWQIWWTDVEGARQANATIEEFNDGLVDIPAQAGEARTDEPPPEPLALEGNTFAALWVPDWGTDYKFPIAEGVDRPTVLDAGFVGHYPDTAMPGEVGNFSVAGHRQTYGRPLYDIDTLAEGDSIIVQTHTAWYVYRVTSHQIVDPTQVDVIAPVPGDPSAEATEEMLTLTTCHPLWSIAERYIVHAELDHWIPLEDGMPEELLEES